MATCTVGCKHPHGLILELGEGDSKKSVEIAGANSALVIGGYGLTENVDRAFMDAWLLEFKSNPLVKNGLVFIQEKTNNAQAQAKDQAKFKSGLEPIEPDTTGIQTLS